MVSRYLTAISTRVNLLLMADALSSRQTQILKSLIDEYIETAEPVGSEALEKKFSLGVSPATIRNEMVALTKLGYLKQPHTSAGRYPTPVAMKFYINQLMEEKEMSLAEEVKTKEEVLESREDIDQMMRGIAHSLAQKTGNLAICTLGEGGVWHSGYANLFSQPEFSNLELSLSVFSFIEEVKRIHELFFEKMTGSSPVEIIFGEELGWSGFDYLGIVGSRFKAAGHEGAMAVIGPTRLRYPTVVPVLRYYRNLIEEVFGE